VAESSREESAGKIGNDEETLLLVDANEDWLRFLLPVLTLCGICAISTGGREQEGGATNRQDLHRPVLPYVVEDGLLFPLLSVPSVLECLLRGEETGADEL
jgi:hypothetical protein